MTSIFTLIPRPPPSNPLQSGNSLLPHALWWPLKTFRKGDKRRKCSENRLSPDTRRERNKTIDVNKKKFKTTTIKVCGSGEHAQANFYLDDIRQKPNRIERLDYPRARFLGLDTAPVGQQYSKSTWVNMVKGVEVGGREICGHDT